MREETDPQACNKPIVRMGPSPLSDPARFLAMRVSTKLEESDFKGAVRLASFEDTIAPFNEATFEALKERHPNPHPESTITPTKENHVTEEEVAKAI